MQGEAERRADASSATARRTSGRSTRRSTWPPSGRRRSSSSSTNNLYGEYTPAARRRRRSTTSPERAEAYGMPGVVVDGQDIDAVHAAVGEAVARARARRGPEPARDEDLPLPRPLAHRPGQVPARGRARRAGRRATRSSSSAATLGRRGASARATPGDDPRPRSRPRSTPPPSAPQPAPYPTLEETRTLCLRRLSAAAGARAAEAAEMTYREAINAALEDELAADPAVLLHGRGRRRPTAASSRRTSGSPRSSARAGPQHADLRERLPRRRARHEPRSGLRPIVEIMFARLPADGRRRDRQPAAEVPLHVGRPVRRAGHGPRRSAAATGRFGTQHSATGECWFMHAARPARRAPPGTPGLGLQRPARRDPTTTTRCSSSSTRACTARKGPVGRGERRASSARPRSCAQERT